MTAYARVSIVFFALSAVLNACASNPQLLPNLSVTADATDLLTVDCQLPGRVRQLGQGRIYQEPHRPVKTPASSCAIRGGDFVRYDRADFRTSLNVWLEAAKSGDPQAQTYVGEIFEKGMGIDSDYAEAARWYAMAAAQGYDRARINLGYLYETGLGVDKDVTRALNLYREAAGLSGGNLEYVANADHLARKAQKATLERTREQLAQAQQRLLDVERDYQAQKSTLQRSEKTLRELQQAADEQRVEVARQRQVAVIDNPPLLNAMTSVEKLSNELAKARDSEHAMQQQLAQHQDKAQVLQVQLDAVQSAQRERDAWDNNSAGELQRLSLQLQAVERDRTSLQVTLNTQREQVSELEKHYQEEYSQHRLDIEKLRSSFGDNAAKAERRLSELESALAEREHAIEELQEKLAITGQALLQAAVAGRIPKADTVNQVDYDGLSIELVNLKTEILRSGAIVALLPHRLQRLVVGQIRPSKLLARLDINDDPYQWDADGVFSYTRDDSNQLQIVAQDTTRKQFTRTFRLREPFAADSPVPTGSETDGSQAEELADALARINFGNYYALVAGVSDYQNFNDLANAASDAERMDQVLRNQYGFETQTLIDTGKTDFLKTLASYQKTLDENDNFVLFYSGHCKQASSYAPAYWLLSDADPTKSDTWLSLPSLVSIIDALPARNVLVIADSCSPETLTSTAVPIQTPDESLEQQVSWYRKMVDARVRSVLASGISQPWSGSQQEAGVSPFVAALLDALKTQNNVVSGSQLYGAIRVASATRFRQLLSNAEVRYAPIQHAGHEAGEFLFAHRDLHRRSLTKRAAGDNALHLSSAGRRGP